MPLLRLAVQALFAQNEYAGTAAKTALATELGVELVQVWWVACWATGCWLEG